MCLFEYKNLFIYFFFFLREFQPMTSAPDDSFLSSDQNTNKFLVYAEIEPQISYTTIRDFTIFFFLT